MPQSLLHSDPTVFSSATCSSQLHLIRSTEKYQYSNRPNEETLNCLSFYKITNAVHCTYFTYFPLYVLIQNLRGGVHENDIAEAGWFGNHSTLAYFYTRQAKAKAYNIFKNSKPISCFLLICRKQYQIFTCLYHLPKATLIYPSTPTLNILL